MSTLVSPPHLPSVLVTLSERLAAAVDELPSDRRVLVAIDGPDAAGKTTIASAMAEHVRRPVITASIDGWHNPRHLRMRRGELSPEGYVLDSFDLDALMSECLTPFRSGAGTIRTANFDHRVDGDARAECEAAPHAALLFEGVFLQRPELLSFWDLRIYVHVPESVTLTRALVRDLEQFGSEAEVRRRYGLRYLPGQALYREMSSPIDSADIVIDNSDPANPDVVRWFDAR